MILYFSGTGNSEYVAKRIAEEIGDKTLNLFEKIRNSDYSGLQSGRPWTLVVPTYAWRIPRIVENWLMKTKLSGSKLFYVVMTCGEDNGNAGAYARQLCEKKRMMFRGCMSIVMPENYIAMFQAPNQEESLQIIDAAEPYIQKAADDIRKGKPFPESKASLADRIKSGPVNELFYPMFVHARKFHADDTCVSCGKCVQVCPLKNIRLEDGRPAWGDDCTHCMACICRCPAAAVEYGKSSKGKVRYVCPK